VNEIRQSDSCGQNYRDSRGGKAKLKNDFYTLKQTLHGSGVDFIQELAAKKRIIGQMVFA
jgi:hypothetical protein